LFPREAGAGSDDEGGDRSQLSAISTKEITAVTRLKWKARSAGRRRSVFVYRPDLPPRSGILLTIAALVGEVKF
jgi:hypothetical protein